MPASEASGRIAALFRKAADNRHVYRARSRWGTTVCNGPTPPSKLTTKRPFRPLPYSLRQQWRCCRQPYRLLLPDYRRLLDGHSSPHSQRRLLNSSPTHPHRAGAQGFRRHRFFASFLALDSPAGYRLVFSLLCSNKNILRALVRCTPSPTIQIRLGAGVGLSTK